MTISIHSDDSAVLQQLRQELNTVIANAELQSELNLSEISEQVQDDVQKGDPITGFAVLLTAVGAGGALTVAVGKAGFLTQLARVLEIYVSNGQVRVKIKTPKGGEVELEGSARQIEKILKQYF